MELSKGFLWGVSTAAHQVEGGNHNNQWATWEDAGRIRSGECSGLACDWWTNAERDFDLAQEMGLNSLRLSVEWSRIEPQPDQWNQEAVQRYRQMLQGLIDRGIQPMICLHHFTHPIWFEERGGFLASDAAEVFERFARHAVSEFGDLCHYSVLGELHKLIDEGNDVRGYFHWTLTDNFEWAEGWKLRFGLVALNNETQERTMRNSGRLFSAIAHANGLSNEVAEQFVPRSGTI